MPREEIISHIELHRREQLEFIISLCNQNSHTFNKWGTDAVAEMVVDRLAPYLKYHDIVDQDKVGCHHILKNHRSGPAVYLVGHLDTVFPPDHELKKCRVEGEFLYGPGTSDMKGGIGVIVYALGAAHRAGALDRLNVAVILNSDEEIGSVTSSPLFEQERKNASACLVAECAGPNGEVVVSRNGKAGARIDCYGEDRHISTVAGTKASAVLELSHKIIALESLNASLPGASINVGRIEGGLGSSTIAGQASAQVDIRWVKEEHRPLLYESIEKILSDPSQPGCRTQFTELNSRPAMPFNSKTEILFGQVQLTGRNLGQSVISEHRRGTSDANFFGVVGVPTIDGLGPIGHKEHTVNEYIELASLRDRTALLAHILSDLSFANESQSEGKTIS